MAQDIFQHTAVLVSKDRNCRTRRVLGLSGNTTSTYPMISKILFSPAVPTTGTSVWSGAFGTYVPSKVLVCARNGALPVAVGPAQSCGLV